MSATKFFGVLLAMLAGAVLLVWVCVTAAALVFALAEGDWPAAGTYALLLVVGVAACVLVGWVSRRMARARVQRH
ncbi:hypothetical protein LL946_12545 [Knoellia locipacati]|uniref:hypothetical protein n=1 Tax=Knoellia locipacati TaxID=882824 RepID=UPI00384F63A4